MEIKIEIKKNDLSIKIRYIKANLKNEDILMGYWYSHEHNIEQVFSPFFIEDTWYLFLEGLCYWVNDDFDEKLPLILTRDISEYRLDILKDKKNKTELTLTIRKTAKKICSIEKDA
jgi:hypothetical protein